VYTTRAHYGDPKNPNNFADSSKQVFTSQSRSGNPYGVTDVTGHQVSNFQSYSNNFQSSSQMNLEPFDFDSFSNQLQNDIGNQIQQSIGQAMNSFPFNNNANAGHGRYNQNGARRNNGRKRSF
jgi:hypothetical protein